MVQMLKWSLNAQVPAGPRITQSQEFEIEAYDSIKLEVGIEPADADLEVELSPSGNGQVKALIITSTQYGSDLIYKVNESTSTENMIDQPQVFMGAGAVGLLALVAPTKLFFTNKFAEPVEIEILVGRDATPSN